MALNDEAFKAGELKGQTQEKAAQMMEGAKDTATGAKDKGLEAAQAARDKISEATEATKGKISDGTKAEQTPKQSPGELVDAAKEKITETNQREAPAPQKGVIQATTDGVMGAAAGAVKSIRLYRLLS